MQIKTLSLIYIYFRWQTNLPILYCTVFTKDQCPNAEWFNFHSMSLVRLAEETLETKTADCMQGKTPMFGFRKHFSLSLTFSTVLILPQSLFDSPFTTPGHLFITCGCGGWRKVISKCFVQGQPTVQHNNIYKRY